MIVYNKNLKYGDLYYHICRGPVSDDIEEVNLHKDTECIRNGAFANCENIKTLKLENLKIGSNAFSHCTGLEHLEIYNSDINDDTFSNCGIKTESGVDIIIDGSDCIRRGTFSHAKINSIAMKGLVSLDDYVFYGAIFTNPVLVLPDGFKTLCSHVFDYSNLTDIYFPDSCNIIAKMNDLDNINLHMSKKLFEKLKFKPADNIIIVDDSIDNMLGKYTFREINDLRIKESTIGR